MSAMGNALPMYDSAATSIRLLQKSSRGSIWAIVMMLGMRASVSRKLGPTSGERNVQKGPDIMLPAFVWDGSLDSPTSLIAKRLAGTFLSAVPSGVLGSIPSD